MVYAMEVAILPDGNVTEFNRYLYLLCQVVEAYRTLGWRFQYVRTSTRPMPKMAPSPRTWT